MLFGGQRDKTFDVYLSHANQFPRRMIAYYSFKSHKKLGIFIMPKMTTIQFIGVVGWL